MKEELNLIINKVILTGAQHRLELILRGLPVVLNLVKFMETLDVVVHVNLLSHKNHQAYSGARNFYYPALRYLQLCGFHFYRLSNAASDFMPPASCNILISYIISVTISDSQKQKNTKTITVIKIM